MHQKVASTAAKLSFLYSDIKQTLTPHDTHSVYMMHENVTCAFLSFLLPHPFFPLCTTILLHLSILALVGIGKRQSNLSSMSPIMKTERSTHPSPKVHAVDSTVNHPPEHESPVVTLYWNRHNSKLLTTNQQTDLSVTASGLPSVQLLTVLRVPKHVV